MSILIFIIGLALVLYGSTLHVESIMHQIYSAIFIVGGIAVCAVAGVGYQLSQIRREASERFKLQEPQHGALMQEKADKDRRTVFIGLALLAGLVALIAYQWSHGGIPS